MALIYPLALPSALKFSARNWRKIDVSSDIPSPYTGQSTVVVYDGKWIEATMTLNAMYHAEAQDWSGWLTSLKGYTGTFLMGDPRRPVPLGSAASAPGTPLVRGASQSGDSLDIDGLPNNATGYLKRGDLIQIGTGAATQLYELMTDASSNGSGQATLDLWPDLRSAPADNAAVIVSGAKGLFHRSSPMTDWQVGSDGISRLSFDCKERLT